MLLKSLQVQHTNSWHLGIEYYPLILTVSPLCVSCQKAFPQIRWLGPSSTSLPTVPPVSCQASTDLQ